MSSCVIARLPACVAALVMLASVALAAEYTVSPQGSDADPGTKAAPFATLAKACDIAAPGDTVYLRAGTYHSTLAPKRSGEAGKPIRFAATPGERVVLSGADRLEGAWEKHQGSIYRLATGRKFTQLFVDGKMLLEARWPNSPADDLMRPNRASAGDGTGYEMLADPNLPPGNWNDGIVVIWQGQRWINATRHISDYQPGKSLRFDRDFRSKNPDPYHTSDPYQPRAGNPYYLTGSLAGLDNPGEWFLDGKAGMLYLWMPKGDSPQGDVIEVKQRDLALDARNLGFIELGGVDTIAAAVDMTDAHDCLLEDCRLRYVDSLREIPEKGESAPRSIVTGTRNEWRHCLIAYGASTGLRLAGEDNRLTNCVVHDVAYFGSGRGGLDLGGSVGAQVTHCSVFRTGRDAIQHHGSKRIRLDYNDIWGANMLNSDAGAVYCWGTDGRGGIIAHNWVHDNLGDSTVGIYLDSFSKSFIVHHNLVWNCSASGIRPNCDALDHQVYNNTITQVREPFGTFTYAAYTPTMKGTRIINNLVNAQMSPKNPSQFVQGALGPELSHNGPGAIDRDGVPAAGSAAIDAGIALPGITDGYKGRAPNLGAYESGGERWTAGADWRDPQAAPGPNRDLTFSPRGPITAATMVRDGLLLWLDAADTASVEEGPMGLVRAWHDKSPAKLVARPVDPVKSVVLVPDGLGGKPVMHGTGIGDLRVEGLKREPGALTALLVSQAPEAAGPAWQRLIASFNGDGEEWILPNWDIVRAGGEKPAAYPAQIFAVQQLNGVAIDKLTVMGAAATEGQYLAGDVGEVLVYGRLLRFDEIDAITKYLLTKWSLPE